MGPIVAVLVAGAAVAALATTARAATPSQSTQPDGVWSGAYPLGILPDPDAAHPNWFPYEQITETPPTYKVYREIVHATVIPPKSLENPGLYEGQVLVWGDEAIVTNPDPHTWAAPPAGQGTLQVYKNFHMWIIDPREVPPAVTKLDVDDVTVHLGSMFCAGHAWQPDGTLLIAGLNKKTYRFDPWKEVSGQFEPKLTLVGDQVWSRFYPSVVTTATGAPVMVGGSLDSTTLHADTFPAAQVCSPPAHTIYPWWETIPSANPTGPWSHFLPVALPGEISETFHWYPRTFSTMLGNVFVAFDSAPRVWDAWNGAPRIASYTLALGTSATPHDLKIHDGSAGSDGPAPSSDRFEGNAVIQTRDPDIAPPGPLRERVFTIGGSSLVTNQWYANCPNSALMPIVGTQALDTVDMFTNLETGHWEAAGPMLHKRLVSHSIPLPDGTIYIGGGSRTDFFNAPNVSYVPEVLNYADPVMTPEIFRPDVQPPTPKFDAMAPQSVVSLYHSTAVLLPDGRIFKIGGNAIGMQSPPALRPADTAEIFSPPYLFVPNRVNRVAPLSRTLSYGGSIDLNVFTADPFTGPPMVVLIRPGSMTHATDFDQRHVQLRTEIVESPVPGSQMWKVKAHGFPTSAKGGCPPGWYMLFVVSPNGSVGKGGFIHVTG